MAKSNSGVLHPSASSRKSIPIYACYFSPAFPRLTDGQIGQG